MPRVVITSSQTWTVPVGVESVNVLVVAGGGGGGRAGSGGAGGSGGEVKWQTGVTVTPGEQIVCTVGAGGAGMSGATGAGSIGSDSSFGSLVVAKGGGGGGGGAAGLPTQGSFGGGGIGTDGGPNGGATGLIAFKGGDGANPGGSPTRGACGGGGGAGGNGGNASTGTNSATGGNGGPGLSMAAYVGGDLGVGGAFGGGGGGGVQAASTTTQTGGTASAGGGAGRTDVSNLAGQAGTPNSGGGGGGGGGSMDGATTDGGNGGSGVIVITYGGYVPEPTEQVIVDADTTSLTNPVGRWQKPSARAVWQDAITGKYRAIVPDGTDFKFVDDLMYPTLGDTFVSDAPASRISTVALQDGVGIARTTTTGILWSAYTSAGVRTHTDVPIPITLSSDNDASPVAVFRSSYNNRIFVGCVSGGRTWIAWSDNGTDWTVGNPLLTGLAQTGVLQFSEPMTTGGSTRVAAIVTLNDGAGMYVWTVVPGVPTTGTTWWVDDTLPPIPDGLSSDDHLDMTHLPDGRVLAVSKTTGAAEGQTLLFLSLRPLAATTAVWEHFTVELGPDDNPGWTRPSVTVWGEYVYVFYGSYAGNMSLAYRRAHVSDLSTWSDRQIIKVGPEYSDGAQTPAFITTRTFPFLTHNRNTGQIEMIPFEMLPQGNASGDWSVSGTAVGGAYKSGSAEGSWSVTGSASGSSPHKGLAEGPFTVSGAADGTAPPVNAFDHLVYTSSEPYAWASNSLTQHPIPAGLLEDGDTIVVTMLVGSTASMTPTDASWTSDMALVVSARLFTWHKVWSEGDPEYFEVQRGAGSGSGWIMMAVVRGLDYQGTSGQSTTASGSLTTPVLSIPYPRVEEDAILIFVHRRTELPDEPTDYTLDRPWNVPEFVVSTAAVSTSYRTGMMLYVENLEQDYPYQAPVATFNDPSNGASNAYFLRFSDPTFAPIGDATGAWNVSGAAAGKTPSAGSASGGWEVTADPVTGSTIPKGNASQNIEWAGAASGSRTSSGSATGEYQVSGSSIGQRHPEGAATGGWEVGGTASGGTGSEGTATGGYEFGGSASGRRMYSGSATGDYEFEGSANGEFTAKGSATGSYEVSGTASGKRVPEGAAVGSWNMTGLASGGAGAQGTAAGGFTVGGTASGKRRAIGAAYGEYQRGGSAAGTTRMSGSAGGSYTVGGSSTGKRSPEGVATGGWRVTGHASSSAMHSGEASGLFEVSGSATGRRVYEGQASGSHEWAGTASGKAIPTGKASGGWEAGGGAAGGRISVGRAIDTWTLGGKALGTTERSGSATGEWTIEATMTTYPALPTTLPLEGWTQPLRVIAIRS